MKGHLVLGIESSCDDTAVAAVDRQGQVLASGVARQDSIHAPWGGVWPELASRAHVRAIVPAIDQVMKDAGASPNRLAAIAVTRGPGLIGSLLVGLNAAAALAIAWDVPLIAVNHLRGHLRSADLEAARVTFPATVLLVSGGHTFLAHMTDRWNVCLLGGTRDDSVGEAYDKVARLVGMGFPGGPLIDRLAREGQPVIDLPRPMIREGLEFSFSGLKSAVARTLEHSPGTVHADLAASFVDVVIDVLVTKCRRALDTVACRSLVVVGGVAASPQLRHAMGELAGDAGVELCLPPLKWSTDNGAMIALAGWDYLDAGVYPPPAATPRLPVTEM